MTTSNATRTLSLPTEILLVVASHCSRPTLCALALLNSGMSSVVTSLLYRNVKIPDLNSLKKYVRTLTDHGRPHLKYLPLSLDLDLRHRDLLAVLYIDTLLQEAISHTPNLRNLALRLPPGILERVFQNFRRPLALTRFTCPLSFNKDFLDFLSKQHTLEELVFLDTLSFSSQDNLTNLDYQSLPNLRSISGNLKVLSILIPGRPVSTASTGTWRVTSNGYASFAQVLSLSTAQLDVVDVSLALSDARLSLSNADGLLPALRRYSIKPMRLTLRFFYHEYGQLQGAKRQRDYYLSILEALEDLDLDGFTRLEIFEITERVGHISSVERDRPSVQARSVFETMKQTCPSLKMLNVFGLEIQ